MELLSSTPFESAPPTLNNMRTTTILLLVAVFIITMNYKLGLVSATTLNRIPVMTTTIPFKTPSNNNKDVGVLESSSSSVLGVGGRGSFSGDSITNYLQQDQNNSTIISNSSISTNDSLICHPLLLSQGNKSELGLCNDYYSSFIVMGIIISCHTILIVITVVGLVQKLRKLKQVESINHGSLKVNYITARNPVLMICGALVGWFYTLVMSSRVLIGRKIFPCVIFSLIYYLAVPGLASTIIIRCTRLIALTKLYELKVRIGKREMLQEDDQLCIQQKNKQKINKGSKNDIPLKQQVGGEQPELERNGNIQIVITRAESFDLPSVISQPNLPPPSSIKNNTTNGHQEESGDEGVLSPSPSSLSTSATPSSFNILVGVSPSLSSGTYSSTSGFLKTVQDQPRESISSQLDQQRHQHPNSAIVDITKLHELNCIENRQSPPIQHADEQVEFKMKNPTFENGKLLRVLRFLTGSKFVFIFYTLVLGIHTMLYLTVGVIDYFNYYNTIYPKDITNKKNAFVVDTYIFSPSGCGTGSYNTNIFLGMLFLYAFVSVCLAIISLIVMKKDVWQVKREIVLVAINWILCILVFGVPNMFSFITTLVDYYFPWTATILLSCVSDMIISFTIPVFFLQKIENPNQTQAKNRLEVNVGDCDLFKCLRNQKWNEMFLKYLEQCFACEDIMFWNAVQQFKNVSVERQKRELFYNIYKTYIRIGSPLELNIARKDSGVPEIERQFNDLCATKKHQQQQQQQQNNHHHHIQSQQIVPYEVSNQHHHTLNTKHISADKYHFDLSSQSISVASEIFDQVQTCCEHNMRDHFNRFRLLHDREMYNEVGVERVFSYDGDDEKSNVKKFCWSKR